MTIARDPGEAGPPKATPHQPQGGTLRAPREGPILCLLTTVHPERSLSRALIQHLTQEMPDIDFTMREQSGLDVVWVCGYERGAPGLVARLRERHPRALLVVTGRGPLHAWSEEVGRAGADEVCSWPVPFGRLGRIFHGVVER